MAGLAVGLIQEEKVGSIFWMSPAKGAGLFVWEVIRESFTAQNQALSISILEVVVKMPPSGVGYMKLNNTVSGWIRIYGGSL